jgi:hypothetical protein
MSSPSLSPSATAVTMQISLSSKADQFIERLLAQGYSDPASIVPVDQRIA